MTFPEPEDRSLVPTCCLEPMLVRLIVDDGTKELLGTLTGNREDMLVGVAKDAPEIA